MFITPILSHDISILDTIDQRLALSRDTTNVVVDLVASFAVSHLDCSDSDATHDFRDVPSAQLHVLRNRAFGRRGAGQVRSYRLLDYAVCAVKRFTASLGVS
jgi:hypothetical protein